MKSLPCCLAVCPPPRVAWRQARKFAEQALALDPNYVEAYIRLARTYLTDAQTGWADNREDALSRCIELVQRALHLDANYPDTYNILGAIYLFIRDYDDAIAYTEKAISLNPNHSLAKASLGMILTYAGMPEKSVPLLQDAMRLSPYYPDWFLGELARAYFQTFLVIINNLLFSVRWASLHSSF